MNFLAHLYLSCKEPDLLCGNFLGDFIKNRELDDIPDEWLKGVRLHRHIDSFTDNHKNVRNCTRLLYETQGKYSPVIVDVFFDYMLYMNWQRYSEVPFYDFEANIYSILEDNVDVFPERLKKITKTMIDGRFLRSFTSQEGLEYTFKRMKNRVKFKSNIDKAVEDLIKFEERINHHFNIFFPDVIKMVNGYCEC